MKRRTLVSAAAALTGLKAFAQPAGNDRAARILLPYPPGSGLDVVARYLSDDLRKSWGTAPVIDNRPGASGMLAIAEFKRAAADGQTLLYVTSDQLVGNRIVYKTLPYDVDRDFALVAGVYQTTFVISASQASGIRSVKDLLERARQQPGRVSYATLGKGTFGHLAGELFSANNNISMVHVPFKELGSLTTSVGSGDVDLIVLPIPSIDPLLKTGKAQVLATLSPTRQPYHPQVPTLQEAGGGPIIHVRGWTALVTHKGVPADTMTRLRADITKFTQDDATRQRFAVIGGEPLVARPADLEAIMSEELAYYKTAAARPGVQFD